MSSSPVRDADPPIGVHPDAKRWLWRGFIVGLLVAAATLVSIAGVTLLDHAAAHGQRTAIAGVLMPEDARYRDIAHQLLARPHPERLSGLTIVGDAGKITVLRYHPGTRSFPSTDINPEALAVIARAVGAQSRSAIVIDQLRLETVQHTGQPRWRLRGVAERRLWRATINPNGTDFHLIAPAAAR